MGRCEVEMTDEVTVRVESNQGLASCLLKMFDRLKDEIRYWSL